MTKINKSVAKLCRLLTELKRREMTRDEIMALLASNKNTTCRTMATLLDGGLVKYRRGVRKGRGPKPRLYSINEGW